ncbi:MAG: DUF1844 domain-containing protein [Terracidiphilus sp.]|jgi:hypothetical protein
MTDKPKFEVIDRRKMKAEEEEQQGHRAPEPPEPNAGPRLVVNESRAEAAPEPPPAGAAPEQEFEGAMPPAPTAEESREQNAAYQASAERVEDLLRAQNPGMGKQPPVGFEHLVQQFYLSGMIQMGAGTQEGQRPRVDIVGARTTIDMLSVLAEKTKGNLTTQEDRVLQSVLFELRMAFLELTSMINVQGAAPPPPAKP